jgi:hypothetical protein
MVHQMTPAKRRWSYSLRTLFLMAIIAGYPAMKVAERGWLAENLKSRGALVVTWSSDTGHDPPAILRVFGAEPVQWIEFPPKTLSEFDMNRIAVTFPEASLGSDRPATFWDLFLLTEVRARE